MTTTEGTPKANRDLATPPTAGLWQAIAETPAALELVSKGKKGQTRRTVVERYLSTPATQEQLGADAGVAGASISTMVARTVAKVFPLLPPEIQTAYGSPEQTLLQRQSFANAAIQVRRGQAIKEGTYTGKPLGRRRTAGQ